LIARSPRVGVRNLYFLLLLGLMLPGAMILLPLVKVMLTMHLTFHIAGLILYDVAGYMPFATFIFAGFIRAIPRDLDDMARIEGASRLTIYFRIILPLMGPALATVAIFLSLFSWNDFISPQIILGPGGEQTITTGIYYAVGLYTSNFERIFSLIVLASLPLCVLFVSLQRRFVSGLTQGALKG
jgi:raffinose/stachyose/melibiose transport system permease protein